MRMSQAWLEVTFRGERPLAAYYHLAGGTGRNSFRSRELEPGLVVDFAQEGEPIGIEITSPRAVTFEALARVVTQLGLPPVERSTFTSLWRKS
jgi:hypothetical protein